MATRERADVELEPVDMTAHLDKLELYLSQVCAASPVSRRCSSTTDEQGADPDQGPQAADLRPAGDRDRVADQAGA
jgi:hypothetical protein